MLGNAGACWGVLGRAGACWGMLGNAGACWGMLGRAGACWGMLGNRIDGSDGAGTRAIAGEGTAEELKCSQLKVDFDRIFYICDALTIYCLTCHRGNI